jgi:hypothetical protein
MQLTHVVIEVAADVGDHLPAIQLIHVVIEAAPTTDDHVP